MKVKKGGIYRIIEERQLSKYEKLGFVAVDKDKPKTVKEIKKALDDKNIEYDSDLKKDELLELLEGE